MSQAKCTYCKKVHDIWDECDTVEQAKPVMSPDLLEAVTALRAIRDLNGYVPEEVAAERWEIANEYLDKHPEFGNYFDGNATKSHDPRGTLRNPDGSRSIFDDVDE